MISRINFGAGVVVAMALSLYALPVSAIPILTGGVWTITGTDIRGGVWTGSTITFENQLASGTDFSVDGYFYWTGNNGAYYGRENFTGTLFSNNHLTVLGIGLVPPTSGIVTSVTYNADVSADGHNMINGTWGGNGIPSNAWTAIRDAAPVPVPAAVWLLGSGLGFVFLTLRKRLTA